MLKNIRLWKVLNVFVGGGDGEGEWQQMYISFSIYFGYWQRP